MHPPNVLLNWLLSAIQESVNHHLSTSFKRDNFRNTSSQLLGLTLRIGRFNWQMIKFAFYRSGILLVKRDSSHYHPHFIEVLIAVAWYMILQVHRALKVYKNGNLISSKEVSQSTPNKHHFWCWAISVI